MLTGLPASCRKSACWSKGSCPAWAFRQCCSELALGPRAPHAGLHSLLAHRAAPACQLLAAGPRVGRGLLPLAAAVCCAAAGWLPPRAPLAWPPPLASCRFASPPLARTRAACAASGSCALLVSAPCRCCACCRAAPRSVALQAARAAAPVTCAASICAREEAPLGAARLPHRAELRGAGAAAPCCASGPPPPLAWTSTACAQEQTEKGNQNFNTKSNTN